MPVEFRRSIDRREVTVESYQKMPKQKKAAFLQKIIDYTRTRTIRDKYTKRLFEMFVNKRYAGNSNFMARQAYFRKHMKPKIKNGTLPKEAPYWFSSARRYNKYLTKYLFNGMPHQNRCLVHYMAKRELEKVSLQGTRRVVQSRSYVARRSILKNLPSARVFFRKRIDSKTLTLESYRVMDSAQKAQLFAAVERYTFRSTMRDKYTKRLFEMVAGRRYPGNSNFMARRAYFRAYMKPKLLAGTLPKTAPYWDARRGKYRAELLRKFNGTPHQNRCLMHFIARNQRAKFEGRPTSSLRVSAPRVAQARPRRAPQSMSSLERRFRVVRRLKSRASRTRLQSLMADIAAFLTDERLNTLSRKELARVTYMHVSTAIRLALTYMYKNPRRGKTLRNVASLQQAYRILAAVNRSWAYTLSLREHVDARMRKRLEKIYNYYEHFIGICSKYRGENLRKQYLTAPDQLGARAVLKAPLVLTEMYPAAKIIAVRFAKNHPQHASRKAGVTILLRKHADKFYPVDAHSYGVKPIAPLGKNAFVYGPNSKFVRDQRDIQVAREVRENERRLKHRTVILDRVPLFDAMSGEAVRKQKFRMHSDGSYTVLSKLANANEAFPRAKELWVRMGETRKTRNKKAWVKGARIHFIRRGYAFVPADPVLHGKAKLQFLPKDVISVNPVTYMDKKRRSKVHVGYIPGKTRKRVVHKSAARARTHDPSALTPTQQALAQKYQSQLTPLANQPKPKLPHLTFGTSASPSTHVPYAPALGRSSNEAIEMGAAGCAQFAFRILGMVKAKEIAARGGLNGDAWTMWGKIKEKERRDGVARGTYARLAGGVSLDRFYYGPGKKTINITPKQLYSTSYRDRLVQLIAAARGVIRKNGVAYVTLYYHRSSSSKRALAANQRFLRAARRAGHADVYRDVSPTTHIEVLTGTKTVHFFKDRLTKLFNKTHTKQDYFALFTKSYVDYLIDGNVKLPRLQLQSGEDYFSPKYMKRIAQIRLSILAKAKPPMYLTDQLGNKRRIELRMQQGAYGFFDVKTGKRVQYDPRKKEYLSFVDIASRTEGVTSTFIAQYLYFKSSGPVFGGFDWNALPSKIIHFQGIKWEKQNQTPEYKSIIKLVKKYGTIKTVNSVYADGYRSFADFKQKNGITPKDTVVYYEALRRVGINPNVIRKGALLPIFDMKELRAFFYKEALQKFPLRLRTQHAQSIQVNLSKIRQAKRDDSVTKYQKTQRILSAQSSIQKSKDAIVRRHLLKLRSTQYVRSVRERYSSVGVQRIKADIVRIQKYRTRIKGELATLRARIKDRNNTDLATDKARIVKLSTLEKGLQARIVKLRQQQRSLELFLQKNHVLTITQRTRPQDIVTFVHKLFPRLGIKKLTPQEKQFIIDYIDQLNDSIDLGTVRTAAGKPVLKRWIVGTTVIVPKKVVHAIETALVKHRDLRERSSQVPETVTAGMRGGKLIEFRIPVHIRTSIERASGNNPEIAKMLIYIYAREQGRDPKKSWRNIWGLKTRRTIKNIAELFDKTHSHGPFQVRGYLFKKKVGGVPLYKKLFGFKTYEEFKFQLKHPGGSLGARAAAYLIKQNIRSVKAQYDRLMPNGHRLRNEKVYYAMVLTAYNRGPNVATRAIIDFRLRTFFKALPITSKDAKYALAKGKGFIQKYAHKIRFGFADYQRVRSRAGYDFIRADFPNVYVLSPRLKQSLMVYQWAIAMKHNRFVPYVRDLSEAQIARQARLIANNPIAFSRSKLYKAIVRLAKTHKSPPMHLDKLMFTFRNMKTGISDLNYGYILLSHGQHEKLSRKMPSVQFALKVPKLVKPVAQTSKKPRKPSG